MSIDSRILDLIQRWESHQEQGKNLPLEELCADCPELISEVRRRLKDLQSLAAILDSTTGLGTAVPYPEPGESTPRLPEVPGHEVLAELGRGGMGIVYRARHIRLNRPVALKMVLAGEYASPEQLARFRTEAEAVARLQHPHIVQVYEVGERDGHPYFTMELVAGGSLAQKLNGTPLPAREVAGLGETLARAVHGAHERGVIHRDLKPANVLLATDGTPKITDFGLAKKLDDAAGPTPSEAVMGTPSYMAPEQARGKVKEVGPAADTYALGAILYEMLTGRPPFKAATSLDTIFQVIHDEPVPPSRLVPKLPRDLETICLKALAKLPAWRYPTARALAEELQRFLNGESIQARPVGRVERAVKWSRRHPAQAVAYGLVVLVLVLGLGVVGGTMARLWQQAEGARQQAVGAREQLALALEGEQTAKRQTEVALEGEQKAKRQTEVALEGEQKAKRQAEVAQENFRQLSYLRSVDLAHREWAEANVARADQLLADCPADLRHWEWRYVYHLCHTDLFTLRGHTNAVCCVAFSPDGKHLVSAAQDETVKVWDATTGQVVLTFKGPIHLYWSVAFSPDGKRLASASFKMVKVWDATTGQETLTLKGHTSGVRSVAFSPDGKRLASASYDKTVKVWDATTGQEVLALKGHHPNGVTSVAFSPDGQRLASASYDRTVKVWDATTGQEILTLQGHTGSVWSVAFSPDGQRLASASYDRTVKVWDAASGKETPTLKEPNKDMPQ